MSPADARSELIDEFYGAVLQLPDDTDIGIAALLARTDLLVAVIPSAYIVARATELLDALNYRPSGMAR